MTGRDDHPREDHPREDRATSRSVARARTLTLVLLAVLGGSRLVGLNRSLWQDEAYTAWAYVLRGPDTIRSTEAYIANNHLLFSWLTWAWSQVAGLGEVALRTFAVVPGTIAFGWLAWWLGRRVSWALAATVTGLAIVSDLQAMLVTEARGYGLVLLGAVALVTGGVDAVRRGGWRDDVILVAGGLVATLTVPTSVIPAAITGIGVLAGRRRAPREALRLVALAGAAGLATLVWYRPVLPSMLAGADRVGARWGEPAGWTSPVLAPTDLLAVPSTGHLLPGAPGWLVTVLTLGLLGTGIVALTGLLPDLTASPPPDADGSSQLARLGTLPALGWQVALVPAVTLVVLALIGFHLLARYLAMLLPLVLIGVAAGMVTLVTLMAARSRRVAVGLGVAGVVLLAAGGWRTVVPELTIPRQAFAEVAAVADAVQPAGVLQAAHHIGFTFALRDHDPELVEDRAVLEERVCTDPAPLLYLPPAVEPSPLPDCVTTRGFTEHRFAQRARPGSLSVWVLQSHDGPSPAP